MAGVSIWRMPRTEQVYTFKHEGSGQVFHFAVDQLNAYLKVSGLKPEPILIHADLLEHLIDRGGWEPGHLDGLADEAMENPCTLIVWSDNTHVLADGVHRVLKHAQKGLPTFPAYLVPERIWKRFLIVDFPTDMIDWDDFLKHGDRHEGLSPKARKRASWVKSK